MRGRVIRAGLFGPGYSGPGTRRGLEPRLRQGPAVQVDHMDTCGDNETHRLWAPSVLLACSGVSEPSHPQRDVTRRKTFSKFVCTQFESVHRGVRRTSAQRTRSGGGDSDMSLEAVARPQTEVHDDLLGRLKRDLAIQRDHGRKTSPSAELHPDEIQRLAQEARSESQRSWRELVTQTSGVPLIRLTYSEAGCRLFESLCMHVDVNQAYASILPQWSDVAQRLQMDELKIQWVQTCVRPKEGLTQAVLEMYMQDGGTLGQVLGALLDLECFGVLGRIRQSVDDFLASGAADEVERPRAHDNYFSILATLARAFGDKDPCSRLVDMASGLTALPSHTVLVQGSGRGTDNFDPYQSELHNRSHFDDLEKNSFDGAKSASDAAGSVKLCRILLLFASDGLAHAQVIKSWLQGFEHEGVRAEVFQLNEVSLWFEVLQNPEACCFKWANEADYIIPILTPGFLSEIHSGQSETEDLLPTSAILNRYMYNCLRGRYSHEGCKNLAVRPIIPMDNLNQVGRSRVVQVDPLLRLVWIPMQRSKVEGRLKSILLAVKNRPS